MGYVRTAGMSTAARRRRRRTALVLTGLLVLLIAVFAYAGAYYKGWLGSDEESAGGDGEQVTATATAEPLQPEDVQVNVYNATDRAGLATRTAAALDARGYDVQTSDNDPEKSTVEGAAHIRFGPEGAEAAAVLHDLVPDAELLEDERESAEIDLVLGPDFEEFPEIEDEESEPTSTGGDR
ncbi:LytR C-terminal domain-containing protein [Ornithinicoccus hortensis]|uniref:LytR cell envelope-related transcriptional attenuator n=1 Tax=Ornithinicoccus hortensis TaxID=82346 RepID=A0A542YNI4_9MICO|nr:LytR C-terminal domain-containing protein [Ornithinicoccus hortensis]TQL49675.1 LytR cell envelope-related transcriptional attenuator [Ornithinicoccus hortensis]